MRRPHIGEFSWKIFWVSTIWAALLFPGFLIGPIRVYFGKLPVLLDPSYLLVVLGGILFGVWGGILSPIMAGAAAFAWHRELPLWVFLAAVPLQVLNGTVLPLVRSRLLPGARRLRLRPLLAYLFWALLAMPLLNGAYYAFFGRFYFWGVAPDSPWPSLVFHGLYYALLVIFPGEPLFRVATREAKDLGLLLEDRWSSWSPRLVYFRQRGRVVLALCLCLLPLLLVSILAQQTMAHRRALLQQHWVLERSSWHASLGQTLSRSLESTQTLLELCALEVRRLREPAGGDPGLSAGGAQDPSRRAAARLHPRRGARRRGAPARLRAGGRAETGRARPGRPAAARRRGRLDPGPRPGHRRGGGSGERAPVAADPRRCPGRDPDRPPEALHRPLRDRAAAARRDRPAGGPGRGSNPGPACPRPSCPRPATASASWPGIPLVKDRWDLYYLERLDLPPGMRDYLAEQALWSGSIHLCMIMVLFGVTLLARVIPLHLPTAADRAKSDSAWPESVPGPGGTGDVRIPPHTLRCTGIRQAGDTSA